MNNLLSISQNFLKSTELVEKLVLKSDLTNNDIVLEIGTGEGIITSELLKHSKKVISVEKDTKLFLKTKEKFINSKNLELINADFLDFKLPEFDYKVFSNIPFNITAKVINKLLFSEYPPISCFLITQEEAAKRFMGIGEGLMISLLIKPFYDMSIIHTFRKSDFEPAPSVDTVLFKITQKENPLLNLKDKNSYYDFIVYILNNQKPTLKLRTTKILSSKQFYRLISDLNLQPDVNVIELNLSQWIKLFEYYKVGVEGFKKSLVKESFVRHRSLLEKSPSQNRSKIRLHKTI